MVLCVALCAATALVYTPVLDADFTHFDDKRYVTANPMVHAGLSLESVRWAFFTNYLSNWHPLTWVSLMTDYEIAGLNRQVFHLTNLLLHIANSALLFLALRSMTGAVWRSWFVAALFALHPLHVESVAWVAERKDVLSTFFLMLTIWAYVSYSRRPGLVRFWIVVLLFALGLMSKSMLVSAPILLSLLDYWPLSRLRGGKLTLWKLATDKAPLFGLSVALCAVTMYTQRGGGAVVPLGELGILARIGNAVISCAAYLRKAFVPTDLCCFYPHPHDSIPWAIVAVSAAVCAGISLAAFRLRRSAPYFAMGWLWYLISLLPVIGFVQVGRQAMADRYTYIPLIGIFAAVTWGAADVLSRFGSRSRSSAALGSAVLCALGVTTVVQTGYWRNDISLFTRALRVTRNNFVAHYNLGYVFETQGRAMQAAEHYENAIKIQPRFFAAHANLGMLYLRMDAPENAARHLATADEILPGQPPVLTGLGRALLESGRPEEARKRFVQALRIDPGNDDATDALLEMPLCDIRRAPERPRQGSETPARK